VHLGEFFSDLIKLLLPIKKKSWFVLSKVPKMNTFSGIVDIGRVDINKETTQGLYTPYVVYMQSQL
jgi:hypothetical protein